MPVDRVLRAVVRGQLDPRADRLDVTLIEDRRPRQDECRAPQVGVAVASIEDRPELRVLASFGLVLATEYPCVETGLEAQFPAGAELQSLGFRGLLPGARVGRVAAAAEDAGLDR